MYVTHIQLVLHFGDRVGENVACQRGGDLKELCHVLVVKNSVHSRHVRVVGGNLRAVSQRKAAFLPDVDKGSVFPDCKRAYGHTRQRAVFYCPDAVRYD